MTQPKHPLVIAHRGASGYRPEHSRAAYLLAIEQVADAIEPDIVPTKDGVLVVRHENEISETTDVAERPEFAHLRMTKTVFGHEFTGWFTEDFTWDELSTLRVRERLPQLRPDSAAFDGQEPIQRLADVFELLDDTDLTLVAELKHASYFEHIGLPLDELFAAEAERAGWARGRRLVVECFETRVLRQLHERGLEATNVFLIDQRGAPLDEFVAHGPAAKQFADYLTDEGLAGLAASGFVDGVSFERHLLIDDPSDAVPRLSDLVSRAKAFGLLTYLWTLRPENHFLLPAHRTGEPGELGDWEAEFRLFLDSGIDGVFADHPDLAVRIREQFTR
ncbi:MAG TPA: glycerophosphodiester phosphodiesterase family protein [Terrimesophilobacter sp.]|nr:glycerophosphodiester phosphodiesterase family protein [Terrimesophilobacter sp.]